MFELEVETGLAGGVSEGFDLAVELKSATIEYYSFDLRIFGALGYEFTHLRGGVDVCPFGTSIFVQRGSRCDCATALVINQLRVYVLVGKMHSETRSLRSSGNLFPNAATDFGPGLLANVETHDVCRVKSKIAVVT